MTIARAPLLLCAAFAVAVCGPASPRPAAAPTASPAPTGAPASAPATSQPNEVTGLHHDPTYDVFGYYMPAHEFRIGKWVLDDIAIATPQEFADYERGKRDTPGYAPVLIEFSDTTSPQVENELGGRAHTNRARVLPSAYSVAQGRLEFAGDDRQLGHVTFSGMLDIAAVKRAVNAEGENAETAIVLKGDLTVGSTMLRDVTFTWFGGD